MHEEPQIQIPGGQQPDRGPFNFAILLAGVAAVIILAGFYLWPGRQSPSRGAAPQASAPFGPQEKAYASKIKIENLGLSRAENFLNQEVTILAGEIVNSGERGLQEVDVTVEFADEMNQVALRESRLAFGPSGPPLPAGERHAFEISFEHIPNSWNMQLPVVRVSGLLLSPSK